jgi:hypothetical protein
MRHTRTAECRACGCGRDVPQHKGEEDDRNTDAPRNDAELKSGDANNADIVVTFEGSYDTPGEDPYTAWTQAAWESHYPASDFAALIYNAPGEATAPQPAAACSSLAQQNIRYVYVGTWYDQLPPYFGSYLADALQGNC